MRAPNTSHPSSLDITSSVTYNSSASITDLGTVPAYLSVDDINLKPVDVVPMPVADRTINLTVTFDTMDDGTNRAMFNGKSFHFPQVPTLMSAVSLGSNATIAAAYGPYSFVLNHLEVVDIVVQNGDSGNHPL